MEFSTLVTGIDFGEGPRWHDDRLWYSDFYQHEIRSVDMAGNQRVEYVIDGQPSGLGWLPDGRLLVVSMVSQQVLRVEPDGSIVTHADLSGLVNHKCNDMIVDDDGHAWVGNFGFDLEAGDEMAPTRLVHVRPDGHVAMVGDDLLFPNGAVITDDTTTLIVGETFGGKYTAFPIAADKSLGDGYVWADVPGTFPDGCGLDKGGGIWFADAAGQRCLRVEQGGEVTNEIATTQPVFACALGGPNGQHLFALTAKGSQPSDVAGMGSGRLEICDLNAS